jgi:hypothetical protein
MKIGRRLVVIGRRLPRLLFLETRTVTLPLLLLTALTWGCLAYPSEPAVRLSGLSLQALGLSLVVAQLHRTRALFGQPSVWRSIANWAQRVKGAFAKPLTITAVGLGSMMSTGSAVGMTVTRAKRTLTARVTELEAAVAALRATGNERHGETIKRLEEQQRRLEAERAEREAGHRELESRLERHGVGDMDLALVGVILTLIGIVAATASPELTRLIGG